MTDTTDLIERLRRAAQRLWCNLTHGGGYIVRDPSGRINWQCAACGRYSDDPVPLKDERAAIDREIMRGATPNRGGRDE